MDRNLIFDIGLHKGLDAKFYLRKGYRVVGLEAVPALCRQSAELNREYLANDRFVLMEKALFHRSNATVEFFVNPEKDDWGSLYKEAAEKGLGKATKISVQTISLNDLIAECGVPYYIKCDIEGGDSIFAQQLIELKERPEFVSLEATQADDLAFLRASGYDRFQIVNQYYNPWTKPPKPPKEGNYVDTEFTHEMSGLFGRELPLNGWQNFEYTMKAFLDWYDLRNRQSSLVVGWLDVHATKSNC